MIDLAAIVVGCVLLAVTAIAAVATLRIRGRAPFALATFVAAAATIVVLLEGLSLVDALSRPAILAGQLVLAGLAVGVWHAKGRPRPPAIARPRLATIVEASRAHPAVAALLTLVGFALAVELVLVLRVAPNNWDSMTYHLSRVAYWLQHHSALQWSAGSVRQLDSPPNAELLVAWTMALRTTDQLAGLVQWTALIGTGVAIFSICRLIAFPIAASAFAAGCFVALPQPLLQGTTTQNDLVTACFIVTALVFGIRGLRDRSLGDATVAATSIGLAIGTKGTTLVAMPSIAIVLGYAWLRHRPPRRFVAIACGLAASSVLAFGAFNYVQTLRATGTLFGPIKRIVERTSPVADNLGRVVWSFADTPGTTAPWLELMLRRPFHRVFGDLPHARFDLAIKTGTHEDTSSFGLVGLLVFLPILVVTAIRPRSPPWWRVFALAGLGYLLAFAVANEWNPWIARVLVPGVALGAPMFACLALRPWLAGVVLVLAASGLVPSVLTNEQKPILVPAEAKSIFALDRIHQQTIIRPDILAVVNAINKRLGRTAALGFVGDEDSWDYPLFGKRRERRVVRFAPDEVSVPLVISEGLAGVLYANVAPPAPPLVYRTLGDGFYLVVTREQLAADASKH